MDEVRDKSVALAMVLKREDPGALVCGPEEWGWTGYFKSGADAQAGQAHGWHLAADKLRHGNSDFAPWYLGAMRAAGAQAGKRLLDVFTLHFYPQGGEYGDDVSEATQQKRNRSPRSLFDSTYRDESWINDTVRLIPRMRDWVASHYAGTRLGITEYNWGAEAHINGATAQADIWGIFGRERLDLATRWTTPPTGSPTYNAMKLWRNPGGDKRGFGETGVFAETNAPFDTLTVYAAIRGKDGALTMVLVSKGVSTKPATLPVRVRVTGAGGKAAQVYQVSGAHNGALAPAARCQG